MNKKNIPIIIVFVLMAVVIIFLPDISKLIKSKTNKIEVVDTSKKEDEDEKVEQLTLKSDVVLNLKYPIMRYNLYSPVSYYQNNNFKISNLTNEQILISALTDVHVGNMSTYTGDVGNCTTEKKSIKSTFINSRIRNILSNDLKYNIQDINVFEMQNYSTYVGSWKYNSSIDSFVYYGNCNKTVGSVKYYDLKELYDVKAENKNYTINIYAYMGFAKVEGNKYSIYSDPSYQVLITSGAYTNYDDLNKIFKKLDKKSLKKYKYVFKKGICTYGDYCLSESMWVNE